MALTAIAFPISILWSFLTELIIPFRMDTSFVAIYALAFTCVVIAIPFFVSGITVCLVLTGFPRAVSGLYAADLAGAALGCVLLIGVLDLTDGPTAVLWVAALAGCGAWAFSRHASSRRLRGAALAALALLGAAAIGHTSALWQGFPFVRIIYAKGRVEARAIYESWNSHSLVRVSGDPLAEMPAIGGAERVPAMKLSQLQPTSTTARRRCDALQRESASVEHSYDVTNIVLLRPQPDVLDVWTF